MERKVRTCRSRPPHTVPCPPHGAAATAALEAPPEVDATHKRRRPEERSEQVQQLPSMPVLIDPESFLPESHLEPPSPTPTPTHRHKPKTKKAKKNSRRDKSTRRRHSRHSKPEEQEQEQHQDQRHDGQEERKDMLQTEELVGNVSILEQLLTDKPRQHRRHRLEKKTQPKQYHRHRRQDCRHQADAPSSTSTVSFATSTSISSTTTTTSAARPRHWFGQKKRILEQWRREHSQQQQQQQQMRGDSDA